MDAIVGVEPIDSSRPQVNVTFMENASYPKFLLKKFMGRQVIVRPDSKLLPSLDKLSAVATTVGREVHVFLRPAAIPQTEPGSAAGPATDEPDEYFEFTAEDYARMMAHKKKEEIFLKTKKIRDAEEAERRARLTKAVIRIQFPDSFVLEATFHPSDPVNLLIDLLLKVVLQPQEPFYLYTAPPKQRLKDLHIAMYEAGLAPGALVYFSYENATVVGPYLRPEIAALRDLHLLERQVVHEEPNPRAEETAILQASSSDPSVPKQDAKRPTGGKPKWFKQR